MMFIIGTGIQAGLGVVSHFTFDKKRLAPPKFPDITHWWVGRTVFLLGVIVIPLGLHSLGARGMAWNGYWMWIVLVLFVFLALEKYVGQTHEVFQNEMK